MIPSRNDLELIAPTENNSNIKCNLDMKVTVSNMKKNDTREEKACSILKLYTFLFVIIITIMNAYVCINVKKIQLQVR